MSHKLKHHRDADGTSIDRLADQYLLRHGLNFDFDASEEAYLYQVAIADRDSDVLIGGKERDYFWGLGGHDRIAGEDEDDLLYGDWSKDMLVGDAGSDRLDGGGDHDHLYGGEGADSLFGREGRDHVSEGAGHGSLEGGEGDDTLVGGEGPDAFIVGRTSGDDVIKDFTAGPGMFDHVALRDLRWEDLTVTDAERGALISWEDGSVLLEGVATSQLAQDDFMFADMPDLPPGERAPERPTSERAITDDGPDFKDEKLSGRAFDKAADEALKEGGLTFAFQGNNTYRVVVGTPEDDDQQGGAAWDHFFGHDGDDRFAGRDGDDILNGDAGDDHLDGGIGADKLDGGMGDDFLIGGDQADELMGANGRDHLMEGTGHGMLDGGMGDDILEGGTGADAFIVAPDSGNDVVLDFEALVGMNGGSAEGAFDHVALRDISPDQVDVSDAQVTRMFDGEVYTGALVSWDVDEDDYADGSILLAGVSQDDLRQSDFMFVAEPGFVDDLGPESRIGSYYILPQDVLI